MTNEEFERVLAQHEAEVFWLDIERIRRDYAAQFPALDRIALEALGADEYGTTWHESNPDHEDEGLLSDSTPTFLLDRVAWALSARSFVLDLRTPRVTLGDGTVVAPAS